MRQQKEYRILIIEDNPADAALIRIYLEEAKFPAILQQAANLATGIEMATRDVFDLALLDLTLPDSDRFHTLRQFLESVPDLPVIVMTGFNDEITGVQSVRAGAQDFLVKEEFDGKNLAKSIKYALQRFGRQNKLQQTAITLSNHQEHYRVVHQMAKMGKWDLDIVTYKMRWSDEMFHILGIPPRGFAPTLTDYLDLVHIEDRAQVAAFFNEAICDTEIHRIKHRVVIRNRSLRYIALQARIKYDKVQENLFLIGSMQDITEHRSRRQEHTFEKQAGRSADTSPRKMLRRIAQRQLDHLYAMTDYFATQKLQEPGNGQRSDLLQLTPHFTGILQSTCQIYHLSDFADHLPPVNKTTFSLKKRLLKLLRLAEWTRHPDHDIRLRFDDDLPDLVDSDEEKIHLLFLALFCLPSIDAAYSPKVDLCIGSRKQEENVAPLHLVVSCTLTIPDPEIIRRLIESGQPEELPVDEGGKGSPSPLIMAGKLVQALQGNWRFQNTTPEGCVVELEFPISTQTDTPSIPDPPQEPVRILLVEDHAVHQIAIKRSLTEASQWLQVDVAANGEEGLRMFQEGNYHIVLMDLHMPVLDGVETARRIRSISRTPIIALTSESSPGEKERCYAAGMNDYLAKPFRLPDIYPRILKLIRPNER